MQTDEKDKDIKYKEWCKNNAEFLRRYTSEILSMHKEEWEKMIDEYAMKKIKECFVKMTPDEWSIFINNYIIQDVEKLVEYKTQKNISDIMLNNSLRGYAVSSLNDYVWK